MGFRGRRGLQGGQYGFFTKHLMLVKTRSVLQYLKDVLAIFPDSHVSLAVISKYLLTLYCSEEKETLGVISVSSVFQIHLSALF